MTEVSTGIPHIIHQLWIGDASKAPTKFMATWRDAHVPLGFRYMFWNESEIMRQRKENAEFDAAFSLVSSRVDEMEEINGKADIIRWVILQVYGGVFCDADSVCIEPIDKYLLEVKEGAFSGFENEQARGPGWSSHYKQIYSHKYGLIALGCVGFPPRHPLVISANKWIQENPVSIRVVGERAWFSVGPGLITRLYYGDYERYKRTIRIFPSYYFLPMHYSGVCHYGHERVYAYQEWGSTKQSYATMNQVEVPHQVREPPPHMWVSILVSSYNTRASYVKECLESIRGQLGPFGMEVVWINDGSTEMNTRLLRRHLEIFEGTTRFVRVKYEENVDESGNLVNKGIGYTLNRGVNLCTNEIIIKMDSDDVMVPSRVYKQMQYMMENKGCNIVGAQVKMFSTDTKVDIGLGQTNHPTITWSEYMERRSHWFVNHPTICFRRSAALEAGNYSPTMRLMAEDFEFEMRMMKRFGVIHNMPEILLRYRIHESQVTRSNSSYWVEVRNRIVRHHVEETLEGECIPFKFDF